MGLQAHDDKSKVSFRNIMIKEVNPQGYCSFSTLMMLDRD